MLRALIVASAVAACAAAALATSAPPASAAQYRFVISGRIVDPHNLRPADAMLSLAYDRDGQGLSLPVTVTRDGAFATQTVYPGNYVLMVVRHPYSHTERSMPVGLSIVSVGQGDTNGVTVTIQPDYALAGMLRGAGEPGGAREPGEPGESVRPATAGGGAAPIWSGLRVRSCLAVEGIRLAACLTADETSGGGFVLRNAYGPRILSIVAPERGAGAPGAASRSTPVVASRSAPVVAPRIARVLLDGRDITDVPTDFSQAAGARLEIELVGGQSVADSAR